MSGTGSDRGLQVQGVGDVELSGQGHGPGERHRLLEDRHMAFVPRLRRQPFDLGGHEPADRLVHQPVHLARGGLVGDRGDMDVHKPCRLG